jgi:hypothetical protein
MCENRTKRVSREHYKFPKILEKCQQRRAESAKKPDHYGRGDELQLICGHSERSEESLIKTSIASMTK